MAGSVTLSAFFVGFSRYLQIQQLFAQITEGLILVFLQKGFDFGSCS
jgi:hypothetical protein